MPSSEVLRQHLADANPRMSLVALSRQHRVDAGLGGFSIQEDAHPFLDAGSGEVERGRFGGIVKIATAIYDDGRPHRLAPPAGSTSGQIVTVIEGYGSVLVTDRRLIGGTFGAGICGDLRGGGKHALAFSYDFADLDYASLAQDKGVFGGLKERLVLCGGVNPMGVVTLEIDVQVRETPSGTTVDKVKTSRPFMETLVRARAEWGVASASPRLQQHLQALIAGHWPLEDGDLMAVFGLDDEDDAVEDQPAPDPRATQVTAAPTVPPPTAPPPPTPVEQPPPPDRIEISLDDLD